MADEKRIKRARVKCPTCRLNLLVKGGGFEHMIVFSHYPIRDLGGAREAFGKSFVVTILAARWIVRRLAVPSTSSSRLAMGCVALGLLLIAEFTLVLWLRGLSISQYLASRDPVSGTACYVMLGVFAIMPVLVERPGGYF
jgi:hypothetical protein